MTIDSHLISSKTRQGKEKLSDPFFVPKSRDDPGEMKRHGK